jgi:hypothetical protein
MRFAPTGSQRQGERVYASLNRLRAAMVLVDGEDGLRWSFGSKDMRQGFLELPSNFSIDQLLQSAVENLNLVATKGSTGSWHAIKNLHYMRRYI